MQWKSAGLLLGLVRREDIYCGSAGFDKLDVVAQVATNADGRGGMGVLRAPLQPRGVQLVPAVGPAGSGRGGRGADGAREADRAHEGLSVRSDAVVSRLAEDGVVSRVGEILH